MSDPVPSSWHTSKWGNLGWAETVAKLVAIVAGLFAFALSFPGGGIGFGLNVRLAAFLVFAFLSVGAFMQLTIRLKQREIVSLVFAVVNLLGHLGLLYALLHPSLPPTIPLVFAAFWVLGQLIKLQFLRTTGFTEQGSDSAGMLKFAAVQTSLYVLFAVLVIF